MRITWDPEQSRFLAELTPGEKWREDMDCVRAAGWKTDGPPTWTWYATKSSQLNSLRDKHKPSSGLTLTELALQNYKQQNQQAEQKAALKKQLLDARKLAKKTESFPKPDEYFDDELQITCFVVKPLDKKWVSMHIIPEPPKERCLVCDDPLYSIFDYQNICMFCKKELDNTSGIC